jgi:hypothetical protein
MWQNATKMKRRKQGSKEARKQGSKEARKQGSKEGIDGGSVDFSLPSVQRRSLPPHLMPILLFAILLSIEG